jgi:hypothetical protein
VTFTAVTPDSIDSAKWNRLALQIRADGQISVWLNGKHAITLPLDADIGADRKRYLAILGAALDTHLFVRDLIWLMHAAAAVATGQEARENADH